MKKFLSRFSLSLTALTAALLACVPSAYAAPSGLYLNPSSGTYARDSSFNVQLRLGNSSTTGVQASFNFDATRLQVTGMSNQGSAFNPTDSYNNSNGHISVYSASGSGSGDRIVTTINFRAVDAGSAAVTFSGTNQTLSYVLLVPVWSNVSTTNASYTITAPATPPSSGGGSSSTPGSTSNGNVSSPSGNSSSSSTSQPSSSSATPSPNSSSVNPTPSSDGAYSLPDRNSSPDFQTTPPNKEPWESYQPKVPTSSLIIPWLPIITTTALALLMIGIFVAYRQTHTSNSLRRLAASVVSYRITLSERAELAAIPRIFPRILPILAGAPKLLAYTAPKLLAAGIKQKLLTAGAKIAAISQPPDRHIPH